MGSTSQFVQIIKIELAKVIAHFTTGDVSEFCELLSFRLGAQCGALPIPKWLADVFSASVADVAPRAICDPWAGPGLLIRLLAERCKPQAAIALTPSPAVSELGKVVAPDADWRCGDPFLLLGDCQEEIDVVASILIERGVIGDQDQRITLTLPSGDAVELEDNLGDLILVAASMRLVHRGSGCLWLLRRFSFRLDQFSGDSVNSASQWKRP